MLRRLFPFPILPVIALPVILFGPMLSTGKALFWGTPALQFIPWRNFGWEMVAGGHLPLWNPLLGMGAPLAANYQSAFFYPPNWIEATFWAIGGVGWQAWAATLLVMLHLIWAGLGASFLLRRLGAGILGQTIAGMAFGCSGFLVARAGFLSINAAVAWLPWILLGTFQMVADPRNRKVWIGLVLILAMQLLAGHAQTVWYSYLFAVLWVGFWSWRKATILVKPEYLPPGRVAGEIFLAWMRLGLVIALAAGLAAIQLLPTAEYLLQSQRSSAVDYELAMTYSFWPWRILGLFVPDLFGNPAHGDYWGYANFWEDALYIGLLPALLALSVLLRPGHWPHLRARTADPDWSDKPLEFPYLRRSLAWFLGLVILGGLILALGKNTPIFPWLYRHIPTFSLFQAPARFLIWIEVSLVISAAMGADRWRRPQKRALYWTRLATAGGFAVSLGAGLAWFLMTASDTLAEIALSAIGATALAGLWGLLAGGLSLLAPETGTADSDLYTTRGQHLWLWAVVGLVGLDLVVAGWGLNPGVSLDFYTETPSNASQIAAQSGSGRLYLPEDDESELKFERFFRFDTFSSGEAWQAMRLVLLPNLNMLEGLASVNNFDPLITGRYARWMEHLASVDPKQQANLLNLMAASVVETVDFHSPEGVRFESLAVIAPKSSGSPSISRIRWVSCARYEPDTASAWQQIESGMVDYTREVVIESQTTDPGEICHEPDQAKVEVDLDTPSFLRLKVESRHPGWLVLADQWYPGWVGMVDGGMIEIERGNYLFRTVQVDAGNHIVEFRYRPASFLTGAGISLGAILVLVMVGWWPRFRRR